MRTLLPDRPGALATLARACGDADVNILGLQIFPDLDSVTDELVLRTPEGWDPADVAALVGSSGGVAVSSAPCTEAALADQPTRYVRAARAILARPTSFPEVLARLFDAEADPVTDASGPPQDVLEVSVGDVQVQVRRTAPFTGTEHARAASLAELVGDVLQRSRESAVIPSGSGRRLGGGDAPDLVREGDSVSAVVEGRVVGLATVHPALDDEPSVHPVVLRVDPDWRRRGIGTRLLVEVVRLAYSSAGAEAIVLTTRADNQAVLPMVLAAGMRGRIRMAADVLTVRVPVRDLKPLG